MYTKVTRIDLASIQNQTLDTAITNICDVQKGAGFNLAATFVYGTQLVLIFQKP